MPPRSTRTSRCSRSSSLVKKHPSACSEPDRFSVERQRPAVSDLQRRSTALAPRHLIDRGGGDRFARRLRKVEGGSAHQSRAASHLGRINVRLITQTQIAVLLSESRASPRRRSHLLLHTGHQDQVQRLLVALQPGTYVRPHRHSTQWEMLALHRGRADVLAFDEGGMLIDRHQLNQSAPVIQIPMGVWHAGIALQPDTIVMEGQTGSVPSKRVCRVGAGGEHAGCGRVRRLARNGGCRQPMAPACSGFASGGGGDLDCG
jgi:cupin fold WbuC family metalloprotein